LLPGSQEEVTGIVPLISGKLFKGDVGKVFAHRFQPIVDEDVDLPGFGECGELSFLAASSARD
tara:strand:- start:259 stop:447 length:189 start_codon:yes stop_codon:yes gene_type:complete